MPGQPEDERPAIGRGADVLASAADARAAEAGHRRRQWLLVTGVAGVLTILAVVTVAPRLGDDPPTPLEHTRPPAAPSASQTQPARPPATPVAEPVKLAAGLDPRIAEPDRIRRVLNEPDLELADLQYTSPTDAAASLTNGAGPVWVVLTTRDNWVTATAAFVPGHPTIRALPRGGAAVLPRRYAGRHQPKFVIRGDGAAIPLRRVRAPHPPSRTAFVTGEDFSFGCHPTRVVDPILARIQPPLAQPQLPCGRYWETSAPFSDARGTTHIFATHSRETTDVSSVDQVRFASTSSTGRRWSVVGTQVLHPYQDYVLDYAAGPRGQLAVAATEENIDDSLVLRRLYVSDNGRTWREVPHPRGPRLLGGMAFTSDGSLLIADAEHDRLLRVAPGRSRIRPLRRGPHAATLRYSGRTVVAVTGTSAAVSTDGKHWRTVRPAAARVTPVH